MKARVDNVRIKDLMVVLANLHLDYNAVDIIVYPGEKRVVINPVEDSSNSIIGNREHNNIELGDKDLDII